MTIADYIALGIIFLLLFLAARHMIRTRKKGGCGGCCSECQGCPAQKRSAPKDG